MSWSLSGEASGDQHGPLLEDTQQMLLHQPQGPPDGECLGVAHGGHNEVEEQAGAHFRSAYP